MGAGAKKSVGRPETGISFLFRINHETAVNYSLRLNFKILLHQSNDDTFQTSQHFIN